MSLWGCFTALFLLEIVSVYAGQYYCQTGFTLRGDECFQESEIALNWYQAKAYCESIDASLLAVGDDGNNYDMVPDLCTRGCWLDLQRQSIEDPWIWKSTGREGEYFNWYMTQPDDGASRACVIRRPFFSWETDYCKYRYSYICEKSGSSRICDDSWHAFSGSCYKIVDEKATWADARRFCQYMGSDLVVIETQEEEDFFRAIEEPFSEGYWIGLHLDSSDDIVRLDDIPQGSWSNWGIHDPFWYFERFEDCAYFSGDKWRTEKCLKFLRSICERSIMPGEDSCADGWIHHGGKCYLLVEDPKSWNWARRNCQAYDAVLATIRSGDENSFIEGKSMSGAYWIGLQYIASSDEWRWSSGDTLSMSDFTAFDQAYVESRDIRSCVMIYTNAEDRGRWATDECDSRLGYVCESQNQADDSWLEYGDSFYKVVSGSFYTEKNWTSARRVCQEFGPTADLAVPDSSEEQRFINGQIAGVVGRPLWIGISVHRDGAVLANGHSFEGDGYWALGEPNFFPDPLCAIAGGQPLLDKNPKSNQWDDVSCKSRFFALCQVPASQPGYDYDY